MISPAPATVQKGECDEVGGTPLPCGGDPTHLRGRVARMTRVGDDAARSDEEERRACPRTIRSRR
jgi:hypothetical protein